MKPSAFAVAACFATMLFCFTDSAGASASTQPASITRDAVRAAEDLSRTVAGQTKLVVTPGAVDFGDVQVGMLSGEEVAFSNTGATTLRLQINIGANDVFSSNTGTCTRVSFTQLLVIDVLAAENCTVRFTFRPDEALVHSRRAEIFDISPGGGGEIAAIFFVGTGTQPDLAVAPTQLDFGDVRVGTASAAQIVTLANTGSGIMQMSAFTAPAPFAIVGGSCGAHPVRIAAGMSCTVAFTFNPTATGPASDVESIAAIGVPSSVTLMFTGTGVKGLAIAPREFDVGTVAVGQASDTAVIELRNDGATPLTVSTLSTATAPFARTQAGTCGNTLPIAIAAGAACTLGYAFSPIDSSAAMQQFVVESDAIGDAGFALRGRGDAVGGVVFVDSFELVR